MKISLVILAAGLGSRFDSGIKQLVPVGPNGEIIIDYSIYDALEAGFNKIVFIIRHSLEADFKRIIGNRISRLCEVEYAFQELEDLPAGFEKPAARTKPWGTGHALLACRGIVQEPFAVINADDYYGKEAFRKIYSDRVAHGEEADSYCMAGFILKNTLSENGGVTRGICQVDATGYVQNVTETHHIQRQADGTLTGTVNGVSQTVSENAVVSMNMWGLNPAFLDKLAVGFPTFLRNLPAEDTKAEYLLPEIIGKLLQEKSIRVRMLETPDRWCGVTYHEDQQAVIDSFQRLIHAGVYPQKLFPEAHR